MNSKALKALKRKEAEERQVKYDAMSTARKIAALDQAFGKGLGAKKQRAKLAAQLKAEKVEKAVKKTAPVKDASAKA